ncbi:NADPH-ferredoxin reductase FprA [Geodia barretti]|uniref:NADPH:adrenodoxin oxidoreductase, mitochondrial n=1 Tax=Geodia barretti TaxID=519541 RepID=A0AA35WMF9_GEOBA|nr:NADPH-ferredoxin reductase FprA [Geodia barretti]
MRIAVFGSGPTGFYATDHLFKAAGVTVEVDLYDRLPTPYGLVRGGVAPDHQKIKSVTRAYERTAQNPRFRFYGGVEFGSDIRLADVRRHYHAVIYCVGAQVDRAMRIPGESLGRSHAATEFVAWYNGHPDYRDREFDLSQESVAVVGVGNVAVDVCRVLARSVDELKTTDIADYALEQLAESRIREIHMLGRRGPAQAAFSNPEIKELGELEGADIRVFEEEAALDAVSQEWVDSGADRSAPRKVEILQQYAADERSGKSRTLTVRFLVSPVELIAGEDGAVTRVKLVKNELYRNERGTVRPRATDHFEDLAAGLGISVPLVKRGPTGVIGTNKADALETVRVLLEDVAAGKHWEPESPSAESAERFVAERAPTYFSFADWKALDALEVARGKAEGRPRVKFVSVEEMQAAIR